MHEAQMATDASTTRRLDPAVLEHLDPRVVVYWLISGTVSWLVMAAVVGSLMWFFRDHVFASWLPASIGCRPRR